MGVFGDNLRRERELRGITLAEISESTKISKRWLQALEDEEFEILPGGVFNRGFVRAYAHFLGINEEEAVGDYITASNEQQLPEDKFPLEIHEKPKSPTLKPEKSVVPVVLAVLGLVLAVGGWTFWIKHRPSASAASSQRPSTMAPSQAADNAPASKAPMPAGLEMRNASQAAQDSNQTQDATSNKSAQNNAPDVVQTTSKKSLNEATAFNVVIKAKESSWISINADGRTLWEGTLNANNQRSVSAGKELVLKTGNAAGIDVSYNGKALGTLGKDKEVRTLTFNTAGLQQ